MFIFLFHVQSFSIEISLHSVQPVWQSFASCPRPYVISVCNPRTVQILCSEAVISDRQTSQVKRSFVIQPHLYSHIKAFSLVERMSVWRSALLRMAGLFHYLFCIQSNSSIEIANSNLQLNTNLGDQESFKVDWTETH